MHHPQRELKLQLQLVETCIRSPTGYLVALDRKSHSVRVFLLSCFSHICWLQSVTACLSGMRGARIDHEFFLKHQ